MRDAIEREIVALDIEKIDFDDKELIKKLFLLLLNRIELLAQENQLLREENQLLKDEIAGSSLFYVGRLNLRFPNLRYIVKIKFLVVLKPLALPFAD